MSFKQVGDNSFEIQRELMVDKRKQFFSTPPFSISIFFPPHFHKHGLFFQSFVHLHCEHHNIDGFSDLKIDQNVCKNWQEIWVLLLSKFQ